MNLSSEDIAWAQGRLRNCTNVKRQLHICAECLMVPDAVLAAALGHSSPDALRDVYERLHPPKKRRKIPAHYWAQASSNDPVIREGVLRYMGGESRDSVAPLLGYFETPTPGALNVRISDWRTNHAAYASRMPCRRPRETKIQKREEQIQRRVIPMTTDRNGLPSYAYAVSPYTHDIVRIWRGETLFYGVKDRGGADTLNAEIDVSPAQAAAMYNGVICGWDTPMADPNNYNAAGEYIGPEMEAMHG